MDMKKHDCVTYSLWTKVGYSTKGLGSKKSANIGLPVFGLKQKDCKPFLQLFDFFWEFQRKTIIVAKYASLLETSTTGPHFYYENVPTHSFAVNLTNSNVRN